MTHENQPPSAAMRAEAAGAYLGVSASSVWVKSREDPKFPKPRKLGNRTTVWLRAELDAYLASLAPRGAGVGSQNQGLHKEIPRACPAPGDSEKT